jgi:hypothetical protein
VPGAHGMHTESRSSNRVPTRYSSSALFPAASTAPMGRYASLCPSGQRSQDAAPWPEYSPGPHASQERAPGTGEALPGTQGAHPPTVFTPVTLLDVPLGQSRQLVDPPTSAYVPRSHGVHIVAPGLPEKDPGPHRVHVMPSVVKLPAGHRVQADAEERVDTLPAGQAVHAVAPPDRGEKVPGAHATQG